MVANLAIYIPTFNRVESLKRNINIISKQIENDVVVYVANNCSDDGTKEYLDSLSYDWLYVEHRQKNLGAAQNHILAWYIPINVKYVWMIGDDDYLMPQAIKTLLGVIKENDVDFIFCNTQAHPVSQQHEVMSKFEQGEITTGNIKGKHQHSFRTKFADLIDPAVADCLMLEIMCLCVKKSSVKYNVPEFTDETKIFEDCGKCYTGSTHPLLNSFSAETPSFYIHNPLTFNFWPARDEWIWNYDYVIPIAILYMIKSYYNLGFIGKEKYVSLLRYYFDVVASSSLHNQRTQSTKAEKFSADIWSHIEMARNDLATIKA